MIDSTRAVIERLQLSRQTARFLLQQAAVCGGEIHLPPERRYSLKQMRLEIATCKEELRALGMLVDDAPEDAGSGTSGVASITIPHSTITSLTSRAGFGNETTIEQAGMILAGEYIAVAQIHASYAGTGGIFQLRAPAADFVGREAAIRTLVAALRPAQTGRTATISGVRGMGGIGKTELAYAVAERLRANYPDAQLLLELAGASDTPLSATQALQKVIRVFQPEQKLSEELSALQTLYRSALTGKRVLILADDARDAAQVRPLLPPSGCALLVTSRQRFMLDGMTVLDLERLDEAAAVVLLCGICSRLTEEQAHQIAALCGHLPLALRVSAGILQNDLALSPERYIARLAKQPLASLCDPDDPARDVEKILLLSYVALDTPTQAIFRRLGVLATDADLSLSAAVLELSQDEADEVLRTLLRRSLVEYDAKRERWGMHDLVRACALKLLIKAGEERAARVWYAEQVILFLRQVQQRGDEGNSEVWEAFSREHTHLKAVRAWLYAQPADTEINRLVMAEANVTETEGIPYNSLRTERVPQLERALAVARHRQDQVAESSILHSLGTIYRDLNEVRQAIDFFEQALVIFQKTGNRHREGRSLHGLGAAYRSLNEPRRAISFFEQALVIFREAGNQRREGSLLLNLADAYRMLGEMQQANACLEQVLVTFRELGDRHGEGIALRHLGDVCRTLSETQQAIAYYEQSLAIFREVGSRHAEGMVLRHLGYAYQDLSETQEASRYYEQALAIFRDVGNRRAEGWVLHRLGDVYRALSEVQQANTYYEQALVAFRELGNRGGEHWGLRGLGDVYRALSNTQQAITCYEQHVAIFREEGDRRAEGWALRDFGDLYHNLGERQQAKDCYEQALTILREEGDRHGEGWVLYRLGDVYRALVEMQQASAYYEQALVIFQEVGNRAGERWTLRSLGDVYRTLGNTQQAITYYEQHIAVLQGIGDRHAEGRALSNLGDIFLDLGEIQQVRVYYGQALTIFREKGNRDEEGEALAGLGYASFQLAEVQQALDLYQQALGIFQELGDQRGEGIVLFLLGMAYVDLNDLPQALHLYDASLQILRAEGEEIAEAHMLNQLSRAYLQQGNPDEALAQSKAALNIVHGKDKREVEGVALRTIAAAHVALGQPAEARANFAASLAILEAIENRPELTRTRWDYGHFLIAQGERERGLALLDACVAYEQHIGHAKADEHAAEVDRLRQEDAL